MKHGDFTIGFEFTSGDVRYRCTDVGTRTIVAIRISGPHRVGTLNTKTGYHGEVEISSEEAEKDGWFNGPPFAVDEIVIDEDDFEICEPADHLSVRT